MAYGLKYFGRFTRGGAVYKVELLLKDYVSTDSEIKHIMTDPVILKRRSKGRDDDSIVLGSDLTFNFYSTVEDASKYDELYTGEWKDWQLKYYKDSTLIWQGWLKTENLHRSFILDHYKISVNATDGLADLKDLEYRTFTPNYLIYEDRVDVLETVKRVLEHTEIALDFKIQLGMESNTMSSGQLALTQVTHDSTRLLKVEDGRDVQESCFTTLEEVLRPFGVEFFQADGFWWIQAKAERNSKIFEIDWTTLAQNSSGVEDNSVDITAYSFEDLGELQQLRLVKHHETTFRDKNLANNLIVNGNFATNSDWTNNGITTATITGGEYVLTDSTGSGYVQNTNFEMLSIPSSAALTITWKAKNTAQTPAADPFYAPALICKLFYGAVEVTPSSQAKYVLIEGRAYETFQTTFPVSTDASNYNVRFYMEKNVTLYTSATVKIDNVVSSANWEIVGSVTTDGTYRVSNDDIVASALTKSVILFGDSANDDDLGAFMISGVRTLTWDRYGETDGLQIQVIEALQRIVQASTYKDYLRLEIVDENDAIKVSHRIKINSTYYKITSYERNHAERIINLELEEIITVDPNYSTTLYPLNSVAGVSQSGASGGGGGAAINDAITSLSTVWSSNKIQNELDSIEWTDIGSKPTTLAGFGITDAYTDSYIDTNFSDIGHDHTGVYEPADSDITKKNEVEIISANWEFSGTPEFSGVPTFSNPALPFTAAVGSGMATNLDANYLNGKADSAFKLTFSENTGFNLPLGTGPGNVAVGNHGHSGMTIDSADEVISGAWTFTGIAEFGVQPNFSVASPTPPMLVVSDIMVPNLNADRLDGVHASGFSVSGHDHDGDYEPYNTEIAHLNANEIIIADWSTSAALGTFTFNDVPSFANAITPFTVAVGSGMATNLDANYLNGKADSAFKLTFSENTGFNLNLGTGSGNVAVGNHTHSGMVIDSADEVISGAWTFSGAAEFGVAPTFSMAAGAPFIITTTTTVVTNLNADRLDGNHASAFATSGHNHTGVYQPYSTTYAKTDADETITGEWEHTGLVMFADVPEFNNAGLPFYIASTGRVDRLNVQYLNGKEDSAFKLTFSENSAFNQAYGTTGSTVAYGNHTHSGFTIDTANEVISGDWTFTGAAEFGVAPSFTAASGAPFTTSLTTVVTNLNADMLDGNHASAFTTGGPYSLTSHTHTTYALKASIETISAAWIFSDRPSFTTPTASPFAVTSTAVVTNLNADRLDGYHAAETSTVSSVAVRNSSGDINARLFRSEYDSTNASCNFIMTQVDTAANNYMRPSTKAQLIASLSLSTTSHNHSGVYEPADANITKNNETETISGNWTFSATHLFDSSTVVEFDSVPKFDGAALPFTCTSTGLVTNLNADLLDGVQGSSYIKFGTSSGTYLYITASSSNAAIRAKQNGSGYLMDWYDATVQRGYMTQAGLLVTVDYKASSDERLKIGFERVDSDDLFKHVLKISDLIRTYKRTDLNMIQELGWGAQTLQKIAPEYVYDPGEGHEDEMWAVGYGKMVVPLYAAVTSIDNRLKRIEKKLNL